MKNLYLIGFSGTGKSSIIKLFENEGYDAIDTDALIEKETGLKIKEIFKQRGEKAFRGLEKDVIFRLSGDGGKIIALGGGAVLDEENIGQIKSSGTVIWLNASSQVIYERLLGDDSRPILSGKGIEEIDALKKSRDDLYSLASDIYINTNELTIEDVFKKVKDYYESCNWSGQS